MVIFIEVIASKRKIWIFVKSCPQKSQAGVSKEGNKSNAE